VVVEAVVRQDSVEAHTLEVMAEELLEREVLQNLMIARLIPVVVVALPQTMVLQAVVVAVQEL
tara:strand:- start:1084 stop:1272 length:189 start_codon:yes stop_codon:yes gene_type:complete